MGILGAIAVSTTVVTTTRAAAVTTPPVTTTTNEMERTRPTPVRAASAVDVLEPTTATAFSSKAAAAAADIITTGTAPTTARPMQRRPTPGLPSITTTLRRATLRTFSPRARTSSVIVPLVSPSLLKSFCLPRSVLARFRRRMSDIFTPVRSRRRRKTNRTATKRSPWSTIASTT